MAQEKDVQRPELDLDAEARAALEEARAKPHGPEQAQAMKKLAISEMRLTCLAYLIRSAEGPQKLRGLFAAPRGASEITALMTDSTQISNKLRPPCSRCGEPLLLSTILPAKPGSELRVYYCASCGPKDPSHCTR